MHRIKSTGLALTTGAHDNCTRLNQRRAHGVGLRRAVDKTSGVGGVRHGHLL